MPPRPAGAAACFPDLRVRHVTGGVLLRTKTEHPPPLMSAGMAQRLLSIWFPRLASDISLRNRPVEGPFALTQRTSNAEHPHCLNIAATTAGLQRGMPLAEARVLCPVLTTRSADLVREARALEGLRRWAWPR